MALTRSVKMALGVVAALAVLATAGTWIYIHVIKGDAPSRLSLNSDTSPTSADAASAGPATLDGTWKVSSGSQAGYRVKEVLFGQNATAVGRTSKVSGSFQLAGTTVSTAKFSVDLTSVTSDQSRRDGQFQHRIMDTSSFPTATFALTKPIDIGSVPSDGSQVTVKATGDLTLHGTTKSVTVDLQAQHSGSNVKVAGSIPVTFADYKIPNPSFGPASTEDHGEIEFLLVLAK